MANRVTLYSRDGQWKADLHAWKDYWIFYASIGAECTVYRRQETKNTWGQSVTDWVRAPTFISMNLLYKGPAGVFPRQMRFNDSHGEDRIWAAGFFEITFSAASAGFQAGPVTVGSHGEVTTTPNTADLSIDSLEAHISVGAGPETMSGTVVAATFVVHQSPW